MRANPVLMPAASRPELPLLEMQHVLRARGGVRVVRHHDDRLALLLVQRLQQIENLIARFAVQIARRFVAQQQTSGSETIARAMPTRCS